MIFCGSLLQPKHPRVLWNLKDEHVYYGITPPPFFLAVSCIIASHCEIHQCKPPQKCKAEFTQGYQDLPVLINSLKIIGNVAEIFIIKWREFNCLEVIKKSSLFIWREWKIDWFPVPWSIMLALCQTLIWV